MLYKSYAMLQQYYNILLASVELKFSLVICFISKQTFRLLYSSLNQCMQKLQNKTNIKYNLNTVYSYGLPRAFSPFSVLAI